MALDPTTLLTSLAAIIGLGYLGSLLFEATRIPDTLLLIGLGVVLGPLTGVLDPGPFRAIAPVLGTFTLLVILFDGGLSLRFEDLFSGLARAGLLAVLGWTLTAGLIGATVLLAHGWPLSTGLLLGAILGGSSSIVVIPIVQRLDASEDTRVALSVESAITDVLAVVGTLTLVGIAAGGQVDLGAALRDVAARFSVAIVAGTVTGFLWGKIWRWIERGSYAYMVTLAALLVLHVVVDAIGGAGPIAVLAFGIMLGNRLELFGGQVSRAWEPGGSMRRFQEEVTFFVRSFFFVALGILVELELLLDPGFLASAGLVFAAILVGRALSTGLSTLGETGLAEHRGLVFAMMPRGLAAAVLAAVPAQQGIAGTESFVAYAFALVVATNVFVTLAMFVLGSDEDAEIEGRVPGSVGASGDVLPEAQVEEIEPDSDGSQA